MKYKKVVLKIGTNVITREDGKLDLLVMKAIANQIAELKKEKTEVVVVSSGAMGAGRGLCALPKTINDVAKRQILAAVGQPALMHEYLQLFAPHQMVCAQVLATKEDFRDRGHYLNMRNCFEALLKENIVPIVNENDTISIDELMFTDNDELAGLIASMIQAEALLILTTVEGVMREGKVVTKIQTFKEVEEDLSPQTSSFGRGGMVTKCHVAEKLSKLGIATHILNGKNANGLIRLMQGEAVGTAFMPKQIKVSSVKRWVAESEGKEQGIVIVNRGAEEMLRSKEKIISLLPVGIVSIMGDFKKGDIIKITNEKGESIGYGVAQYDAAKALEFMGKKGKKELIHYNTLFIQE
ncbi:MAG: glutamate 5-kinase [Candidatus Peregrinibacteria bacterium]